MRSRQRMQAAKAPCRWRRWGRLGSFTGGDQAVSLSGRGNGWDSHISLGIINSRAHISNRANTNVAGLSRGAISYYPIFLELAGRRCVAIGGGAVAERKVEGLLQAGAAVTVISPRQTALLKTWAGEKRIN